MLSLYSDSKTLTVIMFTNGVLVNFSKQCYLNVKTSLHYIPSITILETCEISKGMLKISFFLNK